MTIHPTIDESLPEPEKLPLATDGAISTDEKPIFVQAALRDENETDRDEVTGFEDKRILPVTVPAPLTPDRGTNRAASQV
jgi:hypothetical protein